MTIRADTTLGPLRIITSGGDGHKGEDGMPGEDGIVGRDKVMNVKA